MSIKEDIEDVENKMKKLENESLAMELLKDYKKANSRMFIIILVILALWFATIGAFVYYINTTGFEEDYREQTIEDLQDTDNLNIINGDSYGRRGIDSRYRGDEYMDRMNDDYGRYMESRSRYGAGEEVDKTQHYMVKSLEEFVKFLYEDAETPQQKQMITEALQRSIR